MDILLKENFTQQDIENLIISRLEESINIEFKSAGALSFKESDIKEISKDVSAFANSDGGIIFYGIKEENHIASSISFIDGFKFTKEWLENIIISRIQQKIHNLKIIPIRYDDDFLKTIYVIKIPKSPYNPHINGDKKYYKRYNFQSVPMEEYEVRNSYLKTNDCAIEVIGIFIKLIELKNDTYKLRFEIQITNESYGVAEKYKIACEIIGGEGCNISYDTNLNYNITHKDNSLKLSATNTIAIFPNELLNALCFDMLIPEENFEKIANMLKLNVIIFSLEILSQKEYIIEEQLLNIRKRFQEKAN